MKKMFGILKHDMCQVSLIAMLPGNLENRKLESIYWNGFVSESIPKPETSCIALINYCWILDAALQEKKKHSYPFLRQSLASVFHLRVSAEHLNSNGPFLKMENLTSIIYSNYFPLYSWWYWRTPSAFQNHNCAVTFNKVAWSVSLKHAYNQLLWSIQKMYLSMWKRVVIHHLCWTFHGYKF